MSKEPTRFKQTEIGELPEEWEVKKLGEIATIKQGGRLRLTKKDYVPEGYPAFSATGQDGYVPVYEYEGEAIILSSIGAQCGKCFYATGKWTTLANTQIIFVNPEIANTLFIFYQVNRPNFWMRLGSAQPFIRPSDVKNAKVIIPPLEEQKRIAGVLRLVDRVAEETRRIVDIYERAKRFALKRLLTRGIGHTRFKQTEIGELPEEWEVVKLGEVVDIYDNLRVPLSAKQRANMQGKYPYCGANGIVDYINDYIFDGEYVLLAEDGGYWGAFETSAYIMSGKFWVNNHAHVLKGKSGILVNHFLMYTLNFMDLTGYVGGTTRGKLTQNEMKKILIPLPPLEEQKQIVEMLSTIDAAIENERRYLGVLEKCKRWLLDNLLTGKIRLSPEVDEILKGVLPDAF
jgi:type I restriction enzyme S subunit